MIGLYATASAFFGFFFGLFLLGYYYVTLAHFFAAISPTMVISQVLSGLTFSLLQLFSGLFIQGSQMGGWYFMYVIAGTSHDLTFMALPQFECYAANATSCPVVTDAPGELGPVYLYNVGTTIFSAGYDQVWPNCGWLILIILVIRLIGLGAYHWLNWTKR